MARAQEVLVAVVVAFTIRVAATLDTSLVIGAVAVFVAGTGLELLLGVFLFARLGHRADRGGSRRRLGRDAGAVHALRVADAPFQQPVRRAGGATAARRVANRVLRDVAVQ